MPKRNRRDINMDAKKRGKMHLGFYFYFLIWNLVSVRGFILVFKKQTWGWGWGWGVGMERDHFSAMTWAPQRLKPGVRNSIRLSHMEGRDPTPWAITCWHAGCTVVGSWKLVPESDTICRHSNRGHRADRAQLLNTQPHPSSVDFCLKFT